MHARSIRRLGLVAAAAALVVALAIPLIALSSSAPPGGQEHKRHPGAKALTTAKSGLRDKVPQFERDPSYPQPLPNNWAWGGAGWAQADARDHVWFFHRPLAVPAADIAAGRIPAPPVVELDRDGDFVRGWGGPAWVLPWFTGSFGQTGQYPADTPPEHGIYVDSDRNVWVTGHGSLVLKLTRNGRLLLTIGQFDQTGGSNSTTLLGNPTDMYVDTKANEVYVADGYLNRRVIVFDSETGAYKRHWGAYGNVPDDGPPELYLPGRPLPQQFFVLHCIDVSHDGLVYVCDRQRNRIQVFTKSGRLVKEVVHTRTRPRAAASRSWDPSGTRPSRAPASARQLARAFRRSRAGVPVRHGSPGGEDLPSPDARVPRRVRGRRGPRPDHRQRRQHLHRGKGEVRADRLRQGRRVGRAVTRR